MLRVKLHRVRRLIVSGEMSKERGEQEGYRILEEHYRSTLEQLNTWIIGKGLTHTASEHEEELTKRLERAKGTWIGIVADL